MSVGFPCRPDHPLAPLNIDTSTHATPDLRKKDWGHHHDSEIDASEARRSVERLQYVICILSAYLYCICRITFTIV